MGISLDTGAIRLPRWAVSIFVVLAFTAFSGVFSSKPGGGGGAWWILDLAAGAGCAYLVRRGFRQLREKNMIENVPSSPIRSLALLPLPGRGRAPTRQGGQGVGDGRPGKIERALQRRGSDREDPGEPGRGRHHLEA